MDPFRFPRWARSGLLTLAVATLSTTGCKAGKSKPSPATATSAGPEPATRRDRVGLELQLTPAQLQRVQELETRAAKAKGAIPKKLLQDRANAPLLVYLAATTEAVEIQSAALMAMSKAFSPHGKQRPRPDQDYVKTVQYYLQSPQPRVVASALTAARTALEAKAASADLVSSVTELSERYPSEGGRFALLQTLGVVSADNRTPAVMQLFRSSLAPEQSTYVVAAALNNLFRATRSLEPDPELLKSVLALAQHREPAVRGRAIELLGALGATDDAARKRVLAGLSDAEPFVRAEACEAAARLREQRAVHQLVKLVEDRAPAEHKLDGWVTLSGAPGTLRVRASERKEVRHSALQALRSLSAGELRLEREPNGNSKLVVTENVSRVKSWYAKHRATIPK